MKSGIIPIIACAAVLSSCSSVYKSGQTPDDVYFSPTKETAGYVEVKKDRDESSRYRSTEDNMDDQWLRMRVRNPYRWSSFDEYYYGNDWAYRGAYSPYAYGGGLTAGWNNYWSWNSYYNPYCKNVVIVNPKTNPAAYSTVRNFNLKSYTNNNFNNNNRPKGYIKGSNTYSGFNNSNSSTLGSSIRKVFSGSGSSEGRSSGNVNSSSSSDRPSRSYTPSSSSSSSGRSSGSSSGGSSGGGVSRPSRGGGN